MTEDVEMKQLMKQLNYWHEKNSKLMDPIGCLPENVTIKQDHKAKDISIAKTPPPANITRTDPIENIY